MHYEIGKFSRFTSSAASMMKIPQLKIRQLGAFLKGGKTHYLIRFLIGIWPQPWTYLVEETPSLFWLLNQVPRVLL